MTNTIKDLHKALTVIAANERANLDHAPTNALQAIHAISLKKGFAAEEIMSIVPHDLRTDVWYYTLKQNDTVHEINLKPE